MSQPEGHSSNSSQPWTIIRILKWTTDYLTKKQIVNPRLDAEVLLADLLGLARVDLYINFDKPLSPEELTGFRERVRRRADREPVAYITGKKEFYGLDFFVDPRVLVPRPETESLVDEALRLIREEFPADRDDSEPVNILDIGTGSGAIILALAANISQPACFFATDSSEKALEVAAINAAAQNQEQNVEFICTDLARWFKDKGQSFGIITANLPYVPDSAFADMDADVKAFEPMSALEAGPEGLDIIGRAVLEAQPLLGDPGFLLLEIWPDQAQAIKKMSEDAGYGDIQVLKDLAGHDRVVVLKK